VTWRSVPWQPTGATPPFCCFREEAATTDRQRKDGGDRVVDALFCPALVDFLLCPVISFTGIYREEGVWVKSLDTSDFENPDFRIRTLS
jgi:hypothetical protein